VRIRIVQSGGFAGLRRERVVETDGLPRELRETLEGLIESATFFSLPARLASGLPDVIQYRVRIEESARIHEVTFDDQTGGEALRSLVECIFRAANGT
jgi:hypothetical protein